MSDNTKMTETKAAPEYAFNTIEEKWRQYWRDQQTYKVSNHSDKPKYYVLDMFPYPSGAGLHVGHPLGYIASDIYARFKRLKGFNVLHPMGYDAFGLPAEQYAIEHGVHPAVSTDKNIATFRNQLDKIGFSFDWSREVRTSKPEYYKWTQWIFLQLFNSWYNRKANRTEKIDTLLEIFEKEGNVNHPIPNAQYQVPGSSSREFSAQEWKQYPEATRQSILMEYRVAYCGYGEVNWCEALGTVLANDEVVNGVSERGGHPVVKKKLRQWYLRITEYADRLLQGLQKVDFSEAMKEMQANWIGRSEGAEIRFAVENSDAQIEVYTTRPDTIFGVDFMVLAPEHELVHQITSADQQAAVEEYIAYVKSRSERERMAEKKISGVFTGAYALNPFNQKRIPVWISEYVLAGYGTGAIMAVPSGDERDHKFARHFDIPITNIIGDAYDGNEANPTKDAILSNSDFLDGMVMRDAMPVVIDKLEAMGIGRRKVNYKMRDAAFSRQRYWGEPFPIKWIDGMAVPLDASELPVQLPEVDSYSPGPEGEGPLANIDNWKHQEVKLDLTHFADKAISGKAGVMETNTMPGYAGSSWYFLRYMDPSNEQTFCDKTVSDYWRQVDLYVGGTEHAVGHLLYSRMWTKALYDLGLISFDEPFKKLLNQGMIVGVSQYVYLKQQSLANVLPENDERWKDEEKLNAIRRENQYFVSYDLYENHDSPGHWIFFHVDIRMVDNNTLDIVSFISKHPEYTTYKFYCQGGYWENGLFKRTGDGSDKFYTQPVVEKMSKSKLNTENPDDVVEKYGADTFRMYEMFLGPVEMSKPWDTKGIEGVHRFLKKLWRLFYDEQKGWQVKAEAPTPAELKVLHRTIKKIEEDTERFSFNTCVSAFMVCVNELTDLKCHKKEILEPLVIMLAPFAPHISEELWHQLGHTSSVVDASFPVFDEAHVKESSKEYPISVNGKLRTTMEIDLAASQQEVEAMVLQNEIVLKWLDGKPPKKIIFVKGKMVNVVV